MLDNQTKKIGLYKTLCTSKEQALKNQKEIIEYFKEQIESIGIEKGVDERGNSGWYVYYYL